MLKPNDLGLFDVYGNALEWVLDPTLSYAWPRGKAQEDKPHFMDAQGIQEVNRRWLRGGSFGDLAPLLRSAHRRALPPSIANDTTGFRVAKSDGGAPAAR